MYLNPKEGVIESFEETGWTVKGSLDDTLILRKNPGDSRLAAKLTIERDDRGYNISGELGVPDAEKVHLFAVSESYLKGLYTLKSS